MRPAGPAASAETAARMLAPNRIAPSTAGSTPNRSLNQKAMKLCMTKPPANASSANRADRRSTTPCDRWSPRRVRIVGSTTSAGGTSTAGETRAEQHRQRHADERIADDHGPVGVGRLGHPPRGELRRPRPRPARPNAVGERAGELVAGEQVRPARRVHELRERRLLDGEERPDLVAARADDPDRRRHEQHREHRRGREGEAARQEQDGAHEEDAPPCPGDRRGSSATGEIAASPRSVSVSSSPICAPDRPTASRYRTTTTASSP